MQNEEFLTRLKQVECPDATFAAEKPALVFDKAHGSLIWDVAGRRYIDLCAGFGVLALGHNSLEMQRVFASRLNSPEHLLPITHGMGDVYASRAKVELLEGMIGILPPFLTKAALALSGSQAVEIALKTAMLATRQSGVLVFDGAYHGLDLGLLPVVSRSDFRQPFTGWLKEGHTRSVPYGASGAAVEEAVAQLQASSSGFAAVLVEPVQGRAGVRSAPPGWLAMLREICDRTGALLIFDEVFTGFGRSGRITFAQEVACDLLCLGKALGGGLPLSACVGSEAAMRAWPESTGEALHTGTFFGHPLACEVGLATIRAIHEADLPARARELGAKGLSFLREQLAPHPLLSEVRGEGLMLALEFKQAGYGAKVMDLLREEGLIALASGEQGQSLSLTPALNIPEMLWGEALATLTKVLFRYV